MNPTTRNVAIGVLIFTVIEILTLGSWFHGSSPAIVFSLGGKIRLSVGLYLEHFVSVVVGFNIGTGQPWYRFPLRHPGGA